MGHPQHNNNACMWTGKVLAFFGLACFVNERPIYPLFFRSRSEQVSRGFQQHMDKPMAFSTYSSDRALRK